LGAGIKEVTEEKAGVGSDASARSQADHFIAVASDLLSEVFEIHVCHRICG
jgi:hypothetical protein